MQNILNGKRALVTGGARGIGKAITQQLAAAGAEVIIASRDLQVCEAVARDLTAHGGKVMAEQADLADCASLQELTKRIAARGPLDILVCNAADNPAFGPMHTVTKRKFDRIIQTNIEGNFTLCNLCGAQMAERGTGSIIVLGTISALFGSEGIGVYAMAKAALLQMVRNLALEWGRQGVRANAVSPGLTRTDLGKVALRTPEGRRVIERTPLGRAGEPEDIAGAVLFLASDLSRFVTGQNIVVDGGITIADFS